MPTLYADLVNSPEQVTYKFRFQINGTSAPDALVPAKCGVTSVARSAAGTFAVTFTEKHPVLIGLVGTVLGDDGVTLGTVVQAAVSDYVASTGVLTVRTVDTYADATPAAVDPTDNDWVYLEVTLCRRNGLAPSGAI